MQLRMFECTGLLTSYPEEVKIIQHDNERTNASFCDPDEGQTMILDITELEATDGQANLLAR